MCGIAGLFDPSGRPVEPSELLAMIAPIAHRGPDGDGVWTEGPVGLGHRRLSIIDLEGGAQPLESATGRTLITYNGEIYNYRELRQGLVEGGFPLRTASDTEVILGLYETEGLAGIERLAGMYAFAIWDRREQRLVLARDHAGIKPLYVTRVGGRLAFASEIKALLPVLPCRPALDAQAVNGYFAHQYVGAGRTIYEGIETLPPGSTLVVDAGGERRHTWWRLDPAHRDGRRGADAEELVRDLLLTSVRRHLVSDVPVGLFLSGGIDSSLLLALASRETEGPLSTFSVGFGDDEDVTETRFARQVAERYGSDHHEMHVSASDGLGALPDIVARLDQPLADYAIVPTYLMSRFAAEHVKVVLGGEGADELFGGYKRYRRYAAVDRVAPLPVPMPFPGPPVMDDAARARLLGERYVAGGLLESERSKRVARRSFRGAGAVNAALYVDLTGWLVDDLLMKVDKMGMLASLEARVPYLDPDLVRAVMALDGAEKVGLRETKRVLRGVAKDLVPEEILARPKQGFTVPVASWLRGPLRERFESVVFDAGAAHEWIRPSAVRPLWERLRADDEPGLSLWAVFVFSWWAHEHLS